MAVTTLAQWNADSRPWKPAVPVDDLAETLRGYGYTVYILGNREHETAIPPEDHMPFSNTPWPGPQPYPYVLACDIMPPPAGKGLPTLERLAAQLIKDKRANEPGARWIKYLNESDAAGNCWHVEWQPVERRYTSTDRGHIHVSGRTDFAASTIAAGYDPVARIRGVSDVELTDTIHWKTDGDVKYSAPTSTVEGAISSISYYGLQTRNLVAAMRADLAAERAVVEQLVAALATGGGNVDQAALLAGIDTRLAELRAKVQADTRDAVADEAEGGAAAVREP